MCFPRFFLLPIVWGGILSLFFFLPGCQTKLSKFPEDHDRFERIVNVVEALRQAYVEKNIDGLRGLMLPLEVLKGLQLEVEKDFKTYGKIDLEFTIERMAIKGGRAMVHVRWEGKWKQQPRDFGLIRRGHGILIWSGKQVILLADIGGDLPFGMATRESLS